MEKTAKVIIDKERCKGCKLCITVCPVDILKMSEDTNSHGYNPVMVINQDKCISCGSCAQMCPDLAISVYKEKNNEK